METYLNFFMLPGGQSDTNLFPDVDSSWKVRKVFFATHFCICIYKESLLQCLFCYYTMMDLSFSFTLDHKIDLLLLIIFI